MYLISKNNLPLLLNNGTNKYFESIDLNKSQNELNSGFHSSEVKNVAFLTPKIKVATKYAESIRNQFMEYDTFFKGLEVSLSKKIEEQDLIDNVTKILKYIHSEGYDAGWEKAEKEMDFVSFFRKLNEKEFDINIYCDLIQYVENTKYYYQVDSLSYLSTFLNNSSYSIIDYGTLREMEELYFPHDCIPYPRIYSYFAETDKITKINDMSYLKEIQDSGCFDIVIYEPEDKSGLVGEEPEFIVLNTSILRNFRLEELSFIDNDNDDEISYFYKKNESFKLDNVVLKNITDMNIKFVNIEDIDFYKRNLKIKQKNILK